MFNNKIKKIKGLEECSNLKTLILSFNELEDMGGLQNCKSLVKLDLHNNFLKQVKHLENKEKLVFLDLTHNWISDWGELDKVKEACPQLKELGMKCNPMTTGKSYRSVVYEMFGSLMKLDGKEFSDQDKARIQKENNVLSISLIMDCTKDQRKGFGQD